MGATGSGGGEREPPSGCGRFPWMDSGPGSREGQADAGLRLGDVGTGTRNVGSRPLAPLQRTPNGQINQPRFTVRMMDDSASRVIAQSRHLRGFRNARPGVLRHQPTGDPTDLRPPIRGLRHSRIASVRWRRHGKQTVRDPSQSQPPTPQTLHGRGSNVGRFRWRWRERAWRRSPRSERRVPAGLDPSRRRSGGNCGELGRVAAILGTRHRRASVAQSRSE